MRLAREAYKQMIADDVAWLMACQPSLERDHILAILQCSESREYDRPPAPVAEIRKARMFTAEEMEDAYKEGAYDVRYGSGIQNREWQNSVTRSLIQERAELGPALGMVELKEPTQEECVDILRRYIKRPNETLERPDELNGRAMFDACRAVMWPKDGCNG